MTCGTTGLAFGRFQRVRFGVGDAFAAAAENAMSDATVKKRFTERSYWTDASKRNALSMRIIGTQALVPQLPAPAGSTACMPYPRHMEFSAQAERVLDTALALGAAYADVRFERTRAERIEVRNGDVADLSDNHSEGFGLRALVDGAWGFAASARFDGASLDAAAGRAVAMARASAATSRLRIGTIPLDTYVDRYVTPVERDPASVPLGERVALLLDAERALHSAPTIAVGRACSISGAPIRNSTRPPVRASRKRSIKAAARYRRWR